MAALHQPRLHLLRWLKLVSSWLELAIMFWEETQKAIGADKPCLELTTIFSGFPCVRFGFSSIATCCSLSLTGWLIILWHFPLGEEKKSRIHFVWDDFLVIFIFTLNLAYFFQNKAWTQFKSETRFQKVWRGYKMTELCFFWAPFHRFNALESASGSSVG